MSSVDRHRRRIYSAEATLQRMLDNCATSGNPAVAIDGITLTLPPEARFATVADVQRYVDRVLSTDQVIAHLGQRPPVRVRARRGTGNKAHYEPDTAVIAIPDNGSARAMLRELVVLHEIAHHLDTSGGATHGPAFIDVYLTLLELVMGPQAALALRVLLAHNNVEMGLART